MSTRRTGLVLVAFAVGGWTACGSDGSGTGGGNGGHAGRGGSPGGAAGMQAGSAGMAGHAAGGAAGIGAGGTGASPVGGAGGQGRGGGGAGGQAAGGGAGTGGIGGNSSVGGTTASTGGQGGSGGVAGNLGSGGGAPGGHGGTAGGGGGGTAGTPAGGAGQGGGLGGAGGPGGGGGFSSYTLPSGTLSDLTFYGCSSQYVVGSSGDHGVAFMLGTNDIQPQLTNSTTPILRGAASTGYVGDSGYDSSSFTPVTSADLLGAFDTVGLQPRDVYKFKVGTGGTIFNSFTKQPVTSPTTKTLRAIDGIYGGDAWAVGDDATIIHWNLAQWQSSNHAAEPGVTLRGVSEATSTNVWAVGDAGRAMHWDGSTWTTVPTGTTVNLNAVVHGPVSSGFIVNFFAVGDGGTVLKWDGTSWTSVASPTSAPLFATCSSPRGLLIGGVGALYATPFDSIQWAPYPMNVGFPSTTPAIAALSATDVWAEFSAGTTSQIFHYDGATWTNVSFLKYRNLSQIFFSPGGTVWFDGPVEGVMWTGGAFVSETAVSGGAPAVATTNTDVWQGTGSLLRSDGSTLASTNYSAGPPSVSVVDVTATSPTDVWVISSTQLWQWDGASWTLRPIAMPTGLVGPFVHVRKVGSTIWILTQYLLLRWTGTTLTQWSLPSGYTADTASTRVIPVNDDDVWISGSWGTFQLAGGTWIRRSTAPVLDMSGDATKIWAVTASNVISFTP